MSPILAFCEAREAVRVAEAATKELRAEQNDAVRTVGSLLSESMTRHEVKCVGTDSGRVRLVQSARRSMPIKTEEDALSLVDDVARHLTHVPAEALPVEVSKLVHERAKERGPPPGPPRVALVKNSSTGKNVTDVALAPRETQQLVSQYVGAHAERAQGAAQLAPLRKAKRDAERTLAPLLASQGPAIVQVLRSGNPRNVRLETSTTTAASTTTQRLGIRMLLPLVRLAAVEAAKTREVFDAELKAHLKRLLTDRPAVETKPRVRVRPCPAAP